MTGTTTMALLAVNSFPPLTEGCLNFDPQSCSDLHCTATPLASYGVIRPPMTPETLVCLLRSQ